MNSFFLESRALLCRYLFQPGLIGLDPLFAEHARGRSNCLMISAAEVVAELNRRRRNGRLSPGMFDGATLHLGWEVVQAASFSKVLLSDALIEKAFSLLGAHPLGAVDGIVLGAALDLATERRNVGHDLVLVTTHRGLLRAARREGLMTFNPEAQTEAELVALIGP